MPLEVPSIAELKARFTRYNRAKNVSQADVARVLGVSRQTVQRWNDANSKALPNILQVGIMCAHTKTSIDHLVFGDNHLQDPEKVSLVQMAEWLELNWPAEELASLVNLLQIVAMNREAERSGVPPATRVLRGNDPE